MKPIKRIEGRGQRASRAKDPVTKDGNTVLARDVIESLPYGVVIVDDRGRVLASNRLLSEMLGAEPDRVPLTCCELFGCRQPGTSLQEGCLTEFAQAANGRLSEVLVELPWGGSVGTVWVSVSPLGGVTRCMFHVRPGERRSDQSAPRVDPGQHLRVYTLGRFRLEGAQGPMAGPWLEQRPGQLLKLLCAERHRVVYLEEIAESLWPERGFEALGFVRHFVHVLRNRLEPERARGASSFVLARPGGYAIDRRRVRIDADEFERNLDKARLALSAGDPAGAIGRLEQGAQAVQGRVPGRRALRGMGAGRAQPAPGHGGSVLFARSATSCGTRRTSTERRTRCTASPTCSRWTATCSAPSSRRTSSADAAPRPSAATASCANGCTASSAKNPTSSWPTWRGNRQAEGSGRGRAAGPAWPKFRPRARSSRTAHPGTHVAGM